MTVGLRASFLFGPAWINQGSVQSLLRVWQALSTASKEARQPRPSLRDVLGEPLLSADFEEGWELLDRMVVGKAGRRSEKTIMTRRRRAGHVCFGPYICLVAGRYRIDFDLAPPTGRDRLDFERTIGGVDVVAIQAGWEGAATRFALNDRRVSVSFDVIPSLSTQQIEFRVASFGVAEFEIRSIRLWQLD